MEWVVMQFGRGCEPDARLAIAKSSTVRAARPDPSLRKGGLLGMTIQLHQCHGMGWLRSVKHASLDDAHHTILVYSQFCV